MKPWMIGVGSVLGLGVFVGALNKPKTKSSPVTPPISPNPSTGKTDAGERIWFWNGKVSRTNNIPNKEWFGTTALNDYAGHGNEIYYYVFYENEVKRGQPHLIGKPGSFAWMHNNPGNITGPQPNYGQYPGKYGWHNFMIFPTYQVGFDAIARYLRGPGYANLNIQQAFNKYAPKGDGGNDPNKYAAEVANAAGVSQSTLMSELTDSQMRLMQEKIAQIEGTIPGKIMSYNEFYNEIKANLV